MMGNVWEWTESAYDGTLNDYFENRSVRGGSYNSSAQWLGRLGRIPISANTGDNVSIGFRVVLVRGYRNPIENQTTVTISADDLWDLEPANLYVGSNTAENALVMEDGGRVQNAFGFIGYESGSDSNRVTVTGNGSEWIHANSLRIGRSGCNNALYITDGGYVQNTGSIIGDLAGADSNAVYVTGSGSVWTNSSKLHVGRYAADNLLSVADSGLVQAKIVLVYADDTVVLQSGGRLEISDSITNYTGSTLHIGLNSDTSYGRFTAINNAELGGTLKVTLEDGYIPAAGKSFDLFDSGSVSGGFDVVDLPAICTWNTTLLETEGIISVISSPTSSGIDLRAYQAWEGVYVEFTAYDVETDGTILLALVDATGWVLWSGTTAEEAGPQVVARFLVPEIEAGGSYNFMVRDEVGKWWQATGVSVGSFEAEMTGMTLWGVTLCFDSIPNRDYVIQWTDRLGGTWRSVANITSVADRTELFVEYPISNAPAGFFRVLIRE